MMDLKARNSNIFFNKLSRSLKYYFHINLGKPGAPGLQGRVGDKGPIGATGSAGNPGMFYFQILNQSHTKNCYICSFF